MRFKFTSPTYAEYGGVEAQIATCVQLQSAGAISGAAGRACDAILDCVLNSDAISNGESSSYGAGATILGFVRNPMCAWRSADLDDVDTDHFIHDRHEQE
jgi:hypothetical protein